MKIVVKTLGYRSNESTDTEQILYSVNDQLIVCEVENGRIKLTDVDNQDLGSLGAFWRIGRACGFGDESPQDEIPA